jgi:hypothetical protein
VCPSLAGSSYKVIASRDIDGKMKLSNEDFSFETETSAQFEFETPN